MKVGDMIQFTGACYVRSGSQWHWSVDTVPRNGIITSVDELQQKLHVLSLGQQIVINTVEDRGWGLEPTLIQVVSCG